MNDQERKYSPQNRVYSKFGDENAPTSKFGRVPHQRRNDEVQVIVQIQPERLERVQDLERRAPAVGAIRVQDGEEMRHQFREVDLELVFQSERDLLDERENLRVDDSNTVKRYIVRKGDESAAFCTCRE